MLQDVLAQIPNPFMVEHVEKQPEEKVKQERNFRDCYPLEVRIETILIVDFVFRNQKQISL